MSWFEVSARTRGIVPSMIRSVRAGMGPETIDLGLGQTDLPVSEPVRQAAREVLDKPFRAPYTPNAGLLEARQAVAAHAGVSAEEVLLTCGVQEGLALAILGICDPGDEVLVPEPGFPAYENLVRAAGGTPVPYRLSSPEVPGGPWGLDASAVLERVTERCRLVVLNQPSNPTGAIFAREEMEQLLRGLKEREVLWVSDEIYEDYVWSGELCRARTIPGAGPGITLSGLSKSHHLMGWRLGWLLGPPEIVAALTPLHQHLVTCAPEPAQRASIVALAHHDEVVGEALAILRGRRRIALETFEGLEVTSEAAAAGAFYLFLDVREWLPRFGTTAELAQELLAKEDVLVIPGEGFGKGALGHLRVAYTIGGDPLREGLRRVQNFLVMTRGAKR